MCCRGKCSKPNPSSASQSSSPAAVARPARDSPATRSLKCFEIGQDCQNITFDSSRLCPSDYTGLRPIPGLCTMFAECYKVPTLLSWRDCVSVQGRAYVKECPPGTQFCTIGNICDFPSKVKKNLFDTNSQITCDQLLVPHVSTNGTMADQPHSQGGQPRRRGGGKSGNRVETEHHIPSFAELVPEAVAGEAVTTPYPVQGLLGLAR